MAWTVSWVTTEYEGYQIKGLNFEDAKELYTLIRGQVLWIIYSRPADD